jgi:hypothetical protein
MQRQKPLLIIGIIMVLGSLFISAEDPADKELIDTENGRYYEPVEVPGELVQDLVGAPLKSIAVFSFDGAAWKVVLSQIDERTSDGDFVLTHGPEANAKLGDGKLDGRDLIVFMARDAGQKAPDGQNPEGAAKVVQVEILDPLTNVAWWVYVASFEGNAPVSEQKPYARLMDEKNYNVHFSTYGYDGLTNTKEKESKPTIFINKMWVFPEAGGSNKNIIDRQKIRGEIQVLGGMVKVPINEKIVSGGLAAYKAGPIRIISHSCMYPLFPMNIKGPRFYIDSIMVDTLTLTTTIVNVPFDPGSLIKEMTLVFMTDLAPEAKGMYYYNSENKDGFLIDGKMDEKERAFKNKKDEWRLVTGTQGTQIQCTVFDPKFLTDGKATSTYNDNEKEAFPPENYPGDIGAAADKIVINSLPEGSYQIKTFGCVPKHFYDSNGLKEDLLDQILNISKSPLKIKVSGKEVENQGGKQRQVLKPQGK